ncbi:hypothetical protein ACJMK2_008530 [Sinanodonta woodiana]|uniref:Coiled-coil domain-containing protein n=1 Tax=Sinanodonta woodiana TaxID=1069815 RepID=A0ABD3VN62_SINWO
MAEGRDERKPRDTLPHQGKVKKVCNDWLVYEDGAYAYQVQNDEIEQHYGLNRFHRRTVRDDIPVARVVQDEEEIRQQEERFQELQALTAQAEEDEYVAQRLQQQIQSEAESEKRMREMNDEEIAKDIQEKEKKKYEKYLEKKKERKLKKEREKLEKALQQNSEEAGIVINHERTGSGGTGLSGSTEELEIGVSDISLQRQNGPTATRVTPSGRIEDDGDFSDFYVLPENIEPSHRKTIQEYQDEELARLLQEQEHKRTKAEVDRQKLKEIEEQDERLAQIIHEQEKLRVKKAKEKRKQLQQQKQQQQQTSHRQQELDVRPSQQSRRPESRNPRGFRRDSFIMSLQNGPASSVDDSDNTHINSSIPSPQSDGQILNNSANLSRGNVRQLSQDSFVNNKTQLSPNENQVNSKSMRHVEEWLENSPVGSTNNIRDPHGRLFRERTDHDSLPSPTSPPGSYHSEEEVSQRPKPSVDHRKEEPCYAVSDPFNFNIAKAIDPTYPRRRHELKVQEEKQRKSPVTETLSRSLPLHDDTEFEWDPSLRGSLRRPRGATWNPPNVISTRTDIGTINSLASREDGFHEDGRTGTPWGPVQGQKRNQDRGKKSKKQQPPGSPGPKQKGSCKQQ